MRVLIEIIVGGSNASSRPFNTTDVQNPNTLAVSTRTNTGDRSDDRPSIATLSLVNARSPSTRSARRMAHHTLTTAVKHAQTPVAAFATAASGPYDPDTHQPPLASPPESETGCVPHTFTFVYLRMVPRCPKI